MRSRKYLTFENQVGRSVLPWCMTIVGTLVLSLSREAADGSRSWRSPPISSAASAALEPRASSAHLWHPQPTPNAASSRRAASSCSAMRTNSTLSRSATKPWLFGVHIVAAAVLRGPESLEEDLALALASARILEPDDVFILVPWSHKTVIDAAIQAFLRIPTSIHLGPERVLDRFSDARISKIGRVSEPQSRARSAVGLTEVMAKRVFDIVFASLGLILLSPLLLIVGNRDQARQPRADHLSAAPIRLQPAAVPNLQIPLDAHARGQFRTHPRQQGRCAGDARRTISSGATISTSCRSSSTFCAATCRSSAHGRTRSSIDQMFERRIALYARRHNMKPGITGWAQINGYRGGMSEERMRARVEHDLYYIDHWSMWFDIEILWLTLTSKKAYTNALLSALAAARPSDNPSRRKSRSPAISPARSADPTRRRRDRPAHHRDRPPSRSDRRARIFRARLGSSRSTQRASSKREVSKATSSPYSAVSLSASTSSCKRADDADDRARPVIRQKELDDAFFGHLLQGFAQFLRPHRIRDLHAAQNFRREARHAAQRQAPRLRSAYRRCAECRD